MPDNGETSEHPSEAAFREYLKLIAPTGRVGRVGGHRPRSIPPEIKAQLRQAFLHGWQSGAELTAELASQEIAERLVQMHLATLAGELPEGSLIEVVKEHAFSGEAEQCAECGIARDHPIHGG